ncbi:MAG: IS701 family transposase, partial [Gemmatimonadales bacterium]
MPHKPRHTLATLDPEASNLLPAFVRDFEPVWAGPWARNQETVDAGHRYVEGLILPGERKSMEPLSGRVDAARDAFYQFITRSPWEWCDLQDRLVVAGLRHGVLHKEGGLYLDDLAVPKKGDKSVGVARQYCGVLGKVDNCQALVTVVWGAPAQQNRDSALWPLGMELYLPQEWADDAARRRDAGVPEAVGFRTKNRIALDRLDAIRTQVPHAWTGADAGYGSDGAFRAQLRAWNEAHVVGVRANAFRCRWMDLEGARGGASTPP